jgi:SagB-type dehydrogenase family enzyme
MSVYRKLFFTEGANIYNPKYQLEDQSTWPKEWTTTYYKEYPRFESLALPTVDAEGELLDALATRSSKRNFLNTPVTLDEMGILLKYSCGEFEKKVEHGTSTHRSYASGGARYPLEMYALVFKESEDILPGGYHFNVRKNTLERIVDSKEFLEDPSKIVLFDWIDSVSVLFVMTAVWWRTENKYKSRGGRYVLIEAGHVAQNMALLSEKLGLKCVEVGGVWDDSVEKLLRLDTSIEGFVHAVAIGK